MREFVQSKQMVFYYEEIDEEWTEARRKDIHQLVAGEQRDIEPDTPPSLSVIVQDPNHNTTTAEPRHGTSLVSQNHKIT